MAQPSISREGRSPCAAAKHGSAMITQPAPSDTTNPRRFREKGRLALSGASSGWSSFGRYAPFMVANPATMGSTKGKSTAPQMATSAIPCSIKSAPMIMEVQPVAQAVMVAVIGPVALVMIDIFPPTMLMQELGLVNGCGSFPSLLRSRSAFKTASRPPMAELNVIAVRGAMSGVMSTPLFRRAR